MIEVLNSVQAAEYLKISLSTLYKRTSQRLIPFYKPGKNILFKKSDLEAYLESSKKPSILEVEDSFMRIPKNNKTVKS